MALKSKNNEEFEEPTVEQISFDDLEFEVEFEEERSYTTISGKELDDVQEWEKIPAYELSVGDEFEGIPNISYFENKDKKYDSLRVRVLDDGEFVDAYINIPKPDELGYVTNIHKGFDFYRTCFDFIYSILRWKDESNVVDQDGEEINLIKKVNIINFAKFIDKRQRIGIRITEGNADSEYNSWIIYKIE